MAMIESPVFPLTVSFHTLFGPEFHVDIVQTEGLLEYRNLVNDQPLQRAEVSFDARLPAQIAIVRQWFYVAQGQTHVFRVRDAGDYIVPDENGYGALAVVDGSGGVYQIYKVYTRGASDFGRKITKPEVGTFSLYDDLTLKLLTTHYTIDESTGLVTILFEPAGTLSWRGQFHVPMRFDMSLAQFEIIDRNLQSGYIEGLQSIPLIEVRDA